MSETAPPPSTPPPSPASPSPAKESNSAPSAASSAAPSAAAADASTETTATKIAPESKEVQRALRSVYFDAGHVATYVIKNKGIGKVTMLDKTEKDFQQYVFRTDLPLFLNTDESLEKCAKCLQIYVHVNQYTRNGEGKYVKKKDKAPFDFSLDKPTVRIEIPPELQARLNLSADLMQSTVVMSYNYIVLLDKNEQLPDQMIRHKVIITNDQKNLLATFSFPIYLNKLDEEALDLAQAESKEQENAAPSAASSESADDKKTPEVASVAVRPNLSPMLRPKKEISDVLSKYNSCIRVVSDIHIGSSWFDETANASTLVNMLSNTARTPAIKELILLGDTVEMWQSPMNAVLKTIKERLAEYKPMQQFCEALKKVNASEYVPGKWKQGATAATTSQISESTTPKSKKAVIFVRGNHDAEISMADMRLMLGLPDSEVPLSTQLLGRCRMVALTHGHHDDLFNAPDPQHRAKPLGYYITRVDCSVPIKDKFGPTCGLQLVKSVPPAVWDKIVNAAVTPEVSRMVVSSMLSRSGIDDTSQFVMGKKGESVSMEEIKQQYQDLLVEWQLAGANVADMLKVAAGDQAYAVATHAVALRAKAIVYGHTHEPTMQRYSVTLKEKDVPKQKVLYVNTGSWIYEGRRHFSTFLDIYYNEGESVADTSVALALMRWDAAENKASVMQLQTIE